MGNDFFFFTGMAFQFEMMRKFKRRRAIMCAAKSDKREGSYECTAL